MQSAPLADGSRAVWEWLRDDQEAERGAYALRLGDWRLDGEWTLDHRVSDCGRYLALVASPRRRPCRSAWPYSIAGSGVWSGSPSRWPIYTCKVSSMAMCICSTCSAATPTSRRAGRAKATPACCAASTKACPSPAPGTHSAASNDDWRHYYEQARVAFDGTAWRLCPASRWLDAPPRPWSDGNFVLPSVGAKDAAWGFGFHYEGMHRDEDVRAGFSRDGYLLTASGIGLGNLAAPMIWSADGRYLALTRHVQRYEESELERDQWRLLLLDVQERTLRRLPRRPRRVPVLRQLRRRPVLPLRGDGALRAGPGLAAEGSPPSRYRPAPDAGCRPRNCRGGATGSAWRFPAPSVVDDHVALWARCSRRGCSLRRHPRR